MERGAKRRKEQKERRGKAGASMYNTGTEDGWGDRMSHAE